MLQIKRHVILKWTNHLNIYFSTEYTHMLKNMKKSNITNHQENVAK
jgi:hypothetical protein